MRRVGTFYLVYQWIQLLRLLKAKERIWTMVTIPASMYRNWYCDVWRCPRGKINSWNNWNWNRLKLSTATEKGKNEKKTSIYHLPPHTWWINSMWVYNFYYHMVIILINLIHTCTYLLSVYVFVPHLHIYIQPNRSTRLPVASNSLPWSTLNLR